MSLLGCHDEREDTGMEVRPLEIATRRVRLADLVDLTAGMTFEFNHRATLVLAAVTPVTGPKPFDFEIVTQLNVRFGKTGR